jgi:glycosyltransferase involved in cell wall biosynthesis
MGMLSVDVLAESIVGVIAELDHPGTAITVWGTFLFPYGHAALLAKQIVEKRGTHVRLVISPTGSDIWQIGPQLRSIAEFVLYSEQVDVRLTYTKQFADEIARMLCRTEEIKTLYPVVDLERFFPLPEQRRDLIRKENSIASSDFVLCCHCNMRPVKRPADVIRIAAVTAAQNSDRRLILLMVGPPVPEAICSDIPTNLGIRWMGICGRVESLLHCADVAVNWSIHDSFNGSLMEAMACGIPIVTTDVVGIAGEIIKGGAGRVFNHDDIMGAVAFLDFLIRNEGKRRDIAGSAARHAKCVFSPEELLPRYIQLLFG